MKTIIAGSRQITDREALDQAIADADWDISEVVSGACRGVDLMGEDWARENRILIRQFHADWIGKGRTAGELRNREMAEYAEGLVLLWDGRSAGSACMLREASKAGIKVHVQIYGQDMHDLGAAEQAILDHYWTGGGRLAFTHGHWGWEEASEGAPDVNPDAVASLIRRGLLEKTTIEVLSLVQE